MEYIVIIAAVCTAEFFLRRLADRKLELNKEKEMPGWPVRLIKYQNRGMAGNRLEKRPTLVKLIGVAVLAVLITIFCLTLLVQGKKGLKAGLALIIGGGLANLLERFLHGYVTDYVQFKVPFPYIRKLIFNAADFCVFIGGAVMLLSECRKN